MGEWPSVGARRGDTGAAHGEERAVYGVGADVAESPENAGTGRWVMTCHDPIRSAASPATMITSAVEAQLSSVGCGGARN